MAAGYRAGMDIAPVGGPGSPIYVIDDVVTRPGVGERFFEAYQRVYVPLATANGMSLIHRLVEPAHWLTHESNRLLFMWTVPGIGQLWAAKRAARTDPAVVAWWDGAADMIVERRRGTFCDAAKKRVSDG